MATGKFHGGVTTVSLAGTNVAPSTVVQLAGGLGVVVGEVHRLADLGIALVDGLAGFAGHDLEKIGAAGFQDVAGAVQDLGALGAGECAPGLALLDGGFDDRVQGCLVR